MAVKKYIAELDVILSNLYLCHLTRTGKASGKQIFDDPIGQYAFLADIDDALRFKTGVECLKLALKVLETMDKSYHKSLDIIREP